MSNCVQCGRPTPRRTCRDCSRADRLEDAADYLDGDAYECPSCGGETSGEGVVCYRCRGDGLETDGGERPRGDVYHLVCHDCELEDVTSDRDLAATKEVLHRKRTDHNVEYQEVDR